MVVGTPPFTPSVADVGLYEVCELLYELPSFFCAHTWESFLNKLDGVDSQGEIGGDGEHLFIDGPMVGRREYGGGAFGMCG